MVNSENKSSGLKFVLWCFVSSFIVTFFLAIKKYEHHTTLTSKRMVESEYKLNRRKQEDLVLSYDEFSMLKMTHPDDVYVSDPIYYFTVDGEEIEVDKETYNNYSNGDKIKYECSLIINDRKEIIP